MGYESKLVIIRRSVNDDFNFVFGDELVRFELCCMSHETVKMPCAKNPEVKIDKYFTDIFDTPIDFNLYMGDLDPNGMYNEEDYRKDKYDKHCCYTDLQTVIDWLRNSETIKDYDRAWNCLQCLVAIQNTYPEAVVVHYGH